MKEEYITGYQYSPVHNGYIGIYKFPNNKDKEEIHLPPYTTLVPPPEPWPEPEHPVWNGSEWVLVPDEALSGIPIPDMTYKIDYVQIMDEFVEEQKLNGMWTAKMQELYEAAAEERAKFRGYGPKPPTEPTTARDGYPGEVNPPLEYPFEGYDENGNKIA